MTDDVDVTVAPKALLALITTGGDPVGRRLAGDLVKAMPQAELDAVFLALPVLDGLVRHEIHARARCGAPGGPDETVCTFPSGHRGPWHDNGAACWPVLVCHEIHTRAPIAEAASECGAVKLDAAFGTLVCDLSSGHTGNHTAFMPHGEGPVQYVRWS